MKALQQQARDAKPHDLEADLGARIEMLFDLCPTLCGFSVGQRSIEEAGVPELELFISAIDAYPALGSGQPEQLFNEISAALVDLLDEHPDAAELLPGRTFARTLH
ncbi:MAG TPA: hypothetical protein VET51_05425 [Burkholderiales bacterium]|nr:hypothetical protein [Burkholderiales bacterium]